MVRAATGLDLLAFDL